MHVDRVVLPQVKQLLQSLVDEDDADERGKGLLRESGDVADQGAGVCRHQDETQEGRPQADAGSQRQVGQAIVAREERQRPHGKHMQHYIARMNLIIIILYYYFIFNLLGRTCRTWRGSSQTLKPAPCCQE